jgi:hypothetical protein
MTLDFRPRFDLAADDVVHNDQPCAITDQPSEAEKLPNVDLMEEFGYFLFVRMTATYLKARDDCARAAVDLVEEGR